MPQPPVLVSAPVSHPGFDFLHTFLSAGMQFTQLNGQHTIRALDTNRFESDTVYACNVPLNQLPYQRVNVVALTLPLSFKINNLLIQEWVDRYEEHQYKVSHWEFRHDDLMQSPISVFQFLNHYQYMYHAELMRQEFTRALGKYTDYSHPKETVRQEHLDHARYKRNGKKKWLKITGSGRCLRH